MTDKKETKDTRHDAKRKNFPRLPSSRITDGAKADAVELLYKIDNEASKLDLIVDAAGFALENKTDFIDYRKKVKK